jgi:hypothetical protein
MLMKKKIGDEFEVKTTALMNALFESGASVKQKRWSLAAIEALMVELAEAGLGESLVEKLRVKFLEQLE